MRTSAGDALRTCGSPSRALAALFAAGTAVSWLSLLLPHDPAINEAVSGGLSGLGIPVALALVLVGERLPTWMFHVLLASGTVIVTLGVYFAAGGPASISTASFYVWVALYAAYFFDRRAAMLQIGLAGVLFAVVLVLLETPRPASLWAVLMGTVIVTGMVLGWLSEQMRAMAHTDVLTGLPNRLGLNGMLDREIVRAQRTGEPLCVAVLDIDHFKAVNDTQGHQAGDRLLAELATCWRDSLRTVDVLARYGGDEFVIVLPDCTMPGAEDVLNRLIEASEPGASAGVATWARDDNPDRMLARADEALYRAKRNGRNRVECGPSTITSGTRPAASPSDVAR